MFFRSVCEILRSVELFFCMITCFPIHQNGATKKRKIELSCGRPMRLNLPTPSGPPSFNKRGRCRVPNALRLIERFYVVHGISSSTCLNELLASIPPQDALFCKKRGRGDLSFICRQRRLFKYAPIFEPYGWCYHITASTGNAGTGAPFISACTVKSIASQTPS